MTDDSFLNLREKEREISIIYIIMYIILINHPQTNFSITVICHLSSGILVILGSFLRQTVDFEGVAILNHFQKHAILIVLILELN